MTEISISVPEAFEALFRPKRFKVFYGGRGGAKSWAFADALILDVCNGHRVLCTREYQNSIDDSVHELVKARIDHMGLREDFMIQETAIYHRISGGCFRYAGLARNAESLKSKFGYTRCWIEEAETVSEKSWNLLTPTLREEGSEIWVSYNPNEETSPTHMRYVVPYLSSIDDAGFYEDDLIYVRKVTYRDNPWFKDSPLQQEMERDKESNYKKYLHVWEGECNADYADSIIEPEWVDAAIDAHKNLGFEGRGIKSVGFDPADTGDDAKGLAKRHGSVVLDLEEKKDGDIVDAISWAFDEANEFRADDIVYDSVGIGASVKVYLAQMTEGKQMNVVPFGGADAVMLPESTYQNDRKNKDTFRNRRAQFWWYLRDRFEKTYRAVVKGEYIDPEELISLSSDIKCLNKLKSELVKVQRKRIAGSRLIQLISKEEMKAKGIPSPNLADALVMAFANPPKLSHGAVHIPRPIQPKRPR